MTSQEQRTDQHLILDALCHAYGHLLEHLDTFDEADPKWDAYQLATRCVNQAACNFGQSPVRIDSVSTLCEDLLRRIEGELNSKLPGGSPVFPVFRAYREAVLDSPPPAQINLGHYQEIGERLSRDCYQAYVPDSLHLARPARLVIMPRNQQRFKSRPDKQGGDSTIIFEFATDKFTFDTFVNLSFYFFHEYFSHIHSAEMFAEGSHAPTAFEDGWLLYAAHQFYCQKLVHPSLPGLICPGYRGDYASKYVHDAVWLGENRSVRFGHQRAGDLEMLAGSDLFWRVTLKLASVPYHHLPGCLDLHHEFLGRMKTWLRRMRILPPAEKDEALDLMDLILQDDEPVWDLLELLLEK